MEDDAVISEKYKQFLVMAEMRDQGLGKAFREVFRLGTWDEKDQGREGI